MRLTASCACLASGPGQAPRGASGAAPAAGPCPRVFATAGQVAVRAMRSSLTQPRSLFSTPAAPAAHSTSSACSRRGCDWRSGALPPLSSPQALGESGDAPGQGSQPGPQLSSSQQNAEPAEPRQLPATAKVALFTGVYITLVGAAALAFPLQLLSLLFPASPLGAGWVRVGATLAILFGAYYLGAAADDVEGRKPLRMYQATVLGRALLALVFGGLVAGGQCGAGLLLLGGVNAAGAWRMTQALRQDGVAWRWPLSAAGGSG